MQQVTEPCIALLENKLLDVIVTMLTADPSNGLVDARERQSSK